MLRRATGVLTKWARYNSTKPSALTEPEFSASVIHGRSLYPPLQHPPTHRVPVALIHLRAHHPLHLDLFAHFAEHAAAALAIPASRPIHLPTQRSLWTVLRGPFVHKKSQENFERRVHKRAIKAWDADPEVVDRWVKYLVRHTIPGVGIRVTRWQHAPVGVGREMMQSAVGSLRQDTDAQRVKALADKIVQQELLAEKNAASVAQS
ncbi:ribosomal protein S10 [Leucogyrophana mollusca]|uniref:Ribosomal protein S10 n=1 Tax=Leucogyrophana mollusca TaxID=85980 RepID=A0ACB8BFG8_9AGAM|nr:ribosomal protein S10 [Leucogyrophana mollusca]